MSDVHYYLGKKMNMETERRNISSEKNVVRTPENRKKKIHVKKDESDMETKKNLQR
jgi:hypothetical protein